MIVVMGSELPLTERARREEDRQDEAQEHTVVEAPTGLSNFDSWLLNILGTTREVASGAINLYNSRHIC